MGNFARLASWPRLPPGFADFLFNLAATSSGNELTRLRFARCRHAPARCKAEGLYIRVGRQSELTHLLSLFRGPHSLSWTSGFSSQVCPPLWLSSCGARTLRSHVPQRLSRSPPRTRARAVPEALRSHSSQPQVQLGALALLLTQMVLHAMRLGTGHRFPLLQRRLHRARQGVLAASRLLGQRKVVSLC